MPQVQTTTTINVDDNAYEVAKMSPEIQQMIAYMDEWRQEEVDVSSKLLMVRGALRDIQNAIAATVRDERAEAERRAEAMGVGKKAEATEEPAEPTEAE